MHDTKTLSSARNFKTKHCNLFQKQLQEQDVLLLQQLMNIHFTLRTIRRGNHHHARRSSSIASFRANSMASFRAGSSNNNNNSTKHNVLIPSISVTQPPKPPCRGVLSRVHSEPGGFGWMGAESSPLTSMEEERELENEYLSASYNSYGE